MWVNMDYAVKSGIVAKLQAEGYELKWETANNEATSVDLEGMGICRHQLRAQSIFVIVLATERLGIRDCSPERDGF